MSSLEHDLATQLSLLGIDYVREYRFHPDRRWRADFAFPEAKLLVEVEGGIWKNGRHSRGKGFISDCEKYNEATIRNFRILRVTAEHIKSGQAVCWIEQALMASDECDTT